MRPYLPIAVLALLAIAYTAFWFNRADALRAEVDKWAAEQRQAGMEVSWRAVRVTGFPLRMALEVDHPRIADPVHPNAWAWSGDSLTAHVLPYRFNHVIVRFGGQQALDYRVEDARGGHSAKTVQAAFERASASLVFDRAGLDRLAVDLVGMNARRRPALELSAGALSLFQDDDIAARRIQFHLRRPQVEDAEAPRDTTRDIHLRAEGLSWRTPPLPPLAAEIDHLELAMRLVNLPRRARFNRATLREWTASGGEVDVQALNIVWGDVGVEVNGGFGFDTTARPHGRLRARIGGYTMLVDAMVGEGRLEPRHAEPVKSALDIIAAIGRDGEGRISVPMRFADGYFHLGPVRVMAMPSVY
jgi:hypothetical protein